MSSRTTLLPNRFLPTWAVDNVRVETVVNGPLMAVNGYAILWAPFGLLLPPWSNTSVFATLHRNSELTTLASLMAASANLTSVLNGDGPVTLFAPTNSALARVKNASILYNNVSLWLGHVVEGNWYSSSLTSSNNANSLTLSLGNHRQPLQVTTVGGRIYVGGVLILQSNVLASNGVVHMLDGVLGISHS